MPEPAPTSKRPWWVRFALLGHSSRASVRIAFWFCLLAAAGCAELAMFWKPRAAGPGAGFLLLGGWWHAAAIAWVDKHGGWPGKST